MAERRTELKEALKVYGVIRINWPKQNIPFEQEDHWVEAVENIEGVVKKLGGTHRDLVIAELEAAPKGQRRKIISSWEQHIQEVGDDAPITKEEFDKIKRRFGKRKITYR